MRLDFWVNHKCQSMLYVTYVTSSNGWVKESEMAGSQERHVRQVAPPARQEETSLANL